MFLKSPTQAAHFNAVFGGHIIRRRIEVNKNFSRGKKLRHVPFFLQSQRNDGIGWTNWTSNHLTFSQLRRFCHHLIRWPSGPLGLLFKPPRSKRASSAPLPCLSYPQHPFLPHNPTEAHSFICLAAPVLAVCACRSRHPHPFPLLSQGAGNGPPAVLDLRSGNS